MSKDRSGYVIYGVVFAALITWWVTKKKKKNVVVESGETYSAADEARLIQLVKVYKTNPSLITDADKRWVDRIETVLRNKYQQNPNSITARDRFMGALVS